MEKRIKERAKQALKELEISVSTIAKYRGLSDRTLLDQFNGNSKIGAAALEALLAYCPQLSAEWLLRGAGDMLISSVVPTERIPRDDREATEQITKDEPTTEDFSDAALKEKIEELLNTTLAAYKEKIEELQYIIDLQKDYIDGNKNTIAQLEDFIKHLKAENHELKKAQHTVTVPHAKSV